MQQQWTCKVWLKYVSPWLILPGKLKDWHSDNPSSQSLNCLQLLFFLDPKDRRQPNTKSLMTQVER